MGPGSVCGWGERGTLGQAGRKAAEGSSFLEEVRRGRGSWRASVGPRPAQGAESSPRDAPMAPPRIEYLRLGKCFIERDGKRVMRQGQPVGAIDFVTDRELGRVGGAGGPLANRP